MTDPDAVDIVVVGAGPAGLAAACCAAECGRRVAVVDDNPDRGGQIWRGERRTPVTKESRGWFQRVERAGLDWHLGTTVVGLARPGCLLTLRDGVRGELVFRRLILATGAREIFLPFPGWTLPGVFGAGGLQALVKGGLPVEGTRVAVAGSGPLLLAVAAYLQRSGAEVVVVAEQAPWSKVNRFALQLLMRNFTKFRQGFSLRRTLRRAVYRVGCWPRAARGSDRLESVVFTDGYRMFEEECQYLACGFGLTPNLELPLLLGCHVQQNQLVVNEFQESSVAGVYGAGELCGIGGLDQALVEGQIAGYGAAGEQSRAMRLFSARRRHRRFSQRLAQAFALRGELLRSCEPDTVVCRCEDVRFEALRDATSWREAKLRTRCGMGPCQGRVCGPAVETLFGWRDVSVRPPLYPVPLDRLG